MLFYVWLGLGSPHENVANARDSGESEPKVASGNARSGAGRSIGRPSSGLSVDRCENRGNKRVYARESMFLDPTGQYWFASKPGRLITILPMESQEKMISTGSTDRINITGGRVGDVSVAFFQLNLSLCNDYFHFSHFFLITLGVT